MLQADASRYLDWETFCQPSIFDCLDNIKGFMAYVTFPQFISSGDEKLVARLVDRVYQEVYAVCSDTQLGNLDQIERFSNESTQGSQAGVAYVGDQWEFRLAVTPEPALRLERQGSSFERFYNWYSILMPHFKRFVNAVQDEYEKYLSELRGSEVQIRPTRAIYKFEFVLHEFTKAPRRRRVRNSELLTGMLTHVPDADGRPVPLNDKVLNELGRIDLTISRWNQRSTGRIREIYQLEAPANRDYGALWANFSCIAETSDSELVPRTSPNMDAFIERADLPLNDFLQVNCLTNFLGTLTSETLFKSTTGGLP